MLFWIWRGIDIWGRAGIIGAYQTKTRMIQTIGHCDGKLMPWPPLMHAEADMHGLVRIVMCEMIVLSMNNPA